MVIDTSALVAVLLREPEHVVFARAISGSATRLLSAASYLECAIVIGKAKGETGLELLRRLVATMPVTVVAVTFEQAEAASHAYRRYGRGSHPAKLNFGDCFAYALAMETGEPLLFKGDDFARTDVARAV